MVITLTSQILDANSDRLRAIAILLCYFNISDRHENLLTKASQMINSCLTD